MVTQVIDPIKVPCITLSQDEIDEIKAQMTAGELPRDWLDRYQLALAKNVFGHDAQQDRDGNWIEQGLGAKGHETANHFAALKKSEAMELELPGVYDKALADIWKRDPKRAAALRLPRV
jgi:hypothetical protein